MTKNPTPTEKSKKQSDNTKTPQKTSITQRLRTDLGRSVGVTIDTQLVWLNRLNRLTGFSCVLPLFNISSYQTFLCRPLRYIFEILYNIHNIMTFLWGNKYLGRLLSH